MQPFDTARIMDSERKDYRTIGLSKESNTLKFFYIKYEIALFSSSK
jgi:hypothetical protein